MSYEKSHADSVIDMIDEVMVADAVMHHGGYDVLIDMLGDWSSDECDTIRRVHLIMSCPNTSEAMAAEAFTRYRTLVGSYITDIAVAKLS